MVWRKIAFVLVVISWCGTVRAATQEVSLYAAASTTSVLKTLADHYGKSHREVVLLTQFGSSGRLAKQIEAGAPADIYISANHAWLVFLLDKKTVLAQDTCQTLFGNALVVVGHAPKSVRSLPDLVGTGKIAIGQPSTVPAGAYAMQAFTSAGCAGALRDQLVYTRDVRHALRLAEQNLVTSALVYRSDAVLSQKVVTQYSVPEDSHDKILYYIALTKKGSTNASARQLYAYLVSLEPAGIYESYGFSNETR